MVETICQNCGNRKSFEDSLIGKTFKCPSCSNPVRIQNLGSLLNKEPTYQTNSFAEEIARAESEKMKQDEEAQKHETNKANEGFKTKRKIYLIMGLGMILMPIAAYADGEGSIGEALVGIGFGIWLLYKRKKTKRVEIT